MARLQDFQSVTPAGSDNLLIVQSQGQGLATLNAAGQKIATETTMPSLNTTSKNLVGAVNEVNSGKQAVIPQGSATSLNANNLYGEGEVKVYRSVSGSITNIPGVDGTLMSISNGSGYSTIQIFVNFNGETYVRANWGAGSVSWQDWKPINVYKRSTSTNLQFYRKGDVVYFTITGGSFNTNSSGIIVIDGSTSLIPQGYRPPANCQMWETNLGCRMAAQADGSIWCARTSQTGLVLRVSGCWVTPDNLPS